MPLSTPPARRRLQAEAVGDATVVRFRDPALDEANAEEVGKELLRLTAGLDRPRLRLNLGGVTYLTSTALGMLLVLRKRVRAAGGELTLEDVEPGVCEVFQVTRLTAVFTVRPKGGARGPA
jgi:anti-anti-sigma factor